MTREDLAARLRTTFVDELEEQTAQLNDDLLALEREPRDADRLRSVFRIAHTLKGAARAAGITQIEELCHSMEALLAEARDGRLLLGTEQFALLFDTADALAGAAPEVRAGAPLDLAIGTLHHRLRGAQQTASQRTGETSTAVPAPGTPRVLAPTGTPTPVEGVEGARSTRDEGRQLRVQPEKLDALLASSGQLLISAGRAQSQAELARELSDLTHRLQLEWRRHARIRAAAGESSTQSLDALARRVDHVAAEAARLTQKSGRDAARLWRVAGDVAEKVRGLRMRPFSDATEMLPRLVRDLARQTGRSVSLVVEGEEIEADRAVLEVLRDALLHLVRNAVDHGLETSERRRQAGKPEQGTVRVAAALRGDGLRVTVSDDGAGLNVDAVRDQLRRRGLPVPARERELGEVLFEGGFSTRETATEISGRGVGLDVVRTAVLRIRGRVEVRWQRGRGTTFTIDAPLTLATLRVLLVRSGAHLIAIPTDAVDRLLRMRVEDVHRVDGRPSVGVDGAPVPLAALAGLLGPPVGADEPARMLSAVLVRAGERRVALQVDELLSEQEIMLRPLERLGIPRVERLSGATLLPNGRVALVVHVGSLLHAASMRAAPPALAAPADERPRRRILVVDDSITTRVLEQTVLESSGFEVLTAVDGAEGWALLQERGADLVVTDVEMPRMDGFALCEAIRGSRQFASTPVVLVTSLESEEHRQRGLEVGADAYIVKSSFDQAALIDTIEQLLR